MERYNPETDSTLFSGKKRKHEESVDTEETNGVEITGLSRIV